MTDQTLEPQTPTADDSVVRRAHAAAMKQLREDFRANLRPRDLVAVPVGPKRRPLGTALEDAKRIDAAHRTAEEREAHAMMLAVQSREPDAAGSQPVIAQLLARRGETNLKAPGAFWREVFAESNMTLEELFPYRVRVAWRWAREAGRLLNLVQEDEMLCQVLIPYRDVNDEIVDPWAATQSGYVPSRRDGAGAHHRAKHFDIIQDMVDCSADGGQVGVSILPPELPAEYLDPEHPDLLEQYDPDNPKDDTRLHRWLASFNEVVGYLGMEHGSRRDPNQGRYGLYGLREAAYVRLAFPSKLEIMAYEEIILDEVVRVLVQHGARGVQKRLIDTYGMSMHEIDSMIVLGRKEVTRRVSSDVAEDKALMVMKLEDFIARARKVHGGAMGASREEITGLKQLAIVQGLAKVEASNDMRDILGVIRDVSRMSAEQAKELPLADAVVSDAE